MRIPTLLIMAAIATASTTVSAAQADAKRATKEHAEHAEHREKLTPAEFVKKAGAAGAAEIAMGKLGSEKATNAGVKAYAKRMVADHTKASKELEAYAAANKLTVPTEPDLIHKGMMEKFEHQSADADFNHDFMQQMVRDHKAVVELFDAAAKDSTLDVDLRSFANKTARWDRPVGRPHRSCRGRERSGLHGCCFWNVADAELRILGCVGSTTASHRRRDSSGQGGE